MLLDGIPHITPTLTVQVKVCNVVIRTDDARKAVVVLKAQGIPDIARDGAGVNDLPLLVVQHENVDRTLESLNHLDFSSLLHAAFLRYSRPHACRQHLFF